MARSKRARREIIGNERSLTYCHRHRLPLNLSRWPESVRLKRLHGASCLFLKRIAGRPGPTRWGGSQFTATTRRRTRAITGSNYWSSTEYNSNNAVNVNFNSSNGVNVNNNNKNNTNYVRAFLAFRKETDTAKRMPWIVCDATYKRRTTVRAVMTGGRVQGKGKTFVSGPAAVRCLTTSLVTEP